jgi:predicted peroxiredoxin
MNSAQRDLFGNTVEIDPHDERTYTYLDKYTRDLCRQGKVITPDNMMEIIQAGVKMYFAVRSIKIPQEDIDRIRESKEIQEIANILKNAFDL